MAVCGVQVQLNVYLFDTRKHLPHLYTQKNIEKMKKIFALILPAVCAFALASCESAIKDDTQPSTLSNDLFTPQGVAQMLAALPIGSEQVSEVFNAVSSSSVNGYDEEYMLRDLLSFPGSGVGDNPSTRASSAQRYTSPLKDMISDYLSSYVATKAGGADLAAYLSELSASGMQIYWPYSEQWDGEQMPLITFDPGFGAETNYDMQNSVLIDEELASKRPVWVVNTNDDCSYTPLELYTRSVSLPAASSSPANISPASIFDDEPTRQYDLYMKDFTMLRHYDTWFAGASEFFIKCGAVTAIPALDEDEITNYIPEVTDLMIVVKRSQKGQKIPFNTLLLSGFTDYLEQIALLITESDGGTRTSWKCQAKVMIKSKSYGIDIDLPFYTKDDIVWRGPISLDYLRRRGSDTGRFGDVEISFEVK